MCRTAPITLSYCMRIGPSTAIFAVSPLGSASVTPISASSNYIAASSSYTSLEHELEALLGPTQAA